MELPGYRQCPDMLCQPRCIRIVGTQDREDLTEAEQGTDGVACQHESQFVIRACKCGAATLPQVNYVSVLWGNKRKFFVAEFAIGR